MKTRILFQIILVITLFSGSVLAARFTYDGASAANYARSNAHIPLNQSPFYNFGNVCASFVSQSVIAGMIKTSSAQTVFNRRADFKADSKWFYVKDYNSGDAWRGANAMMTYANSNASNTKGLHMTFIASDTPFNRSLNPLGLRPGDVIFCNWNNSGAVEHVMIVSRIDNSPNIYNKYDRIKVAGQSNPHVDTSLQWIIDRTYEQDHTVASFRVYRPTDYNQ